MVLGSSGMAAFVTSRIAAEMPPMPAGGHPQGFEDTVLQLPEFLREPFAAAMSQSMPLPAFISLFGVAAALFMVGFVSSAGTRQPAGAGPDADRDRYRGGFNDRTERIPVATTDAANDFFDDYDDDEYLESTMPREPSRGPDREPPRPYGEYHTEALTPASNTHAPVPSKQGTACSTSPTTYRRPNHSVWRTTASTSMPRNVSANRGGLTTAGQAGHGQAMDAHRFFDEIDDTYGDDHARGNRD